MKTDRAPGLYVHIPFCRTKCLYCDFVSITNNSRHEDFVGAVLREPSFTSSVFPHFSSIYLGGGAPSCLDPAALLRILNSLKSLFRIDPDAEVTVELNPDDVTPRLIDTLAGAGVNRLSLGIQSLFDDELRFLKRRHTARISVQAIDICRRYSDIAINTDVIFGLPGQTAARIRATLKKLLACQPEHISCYQLTVSSGTPLHTLIRNGGITMPSENRQSRHYKVVAEYLRGEGYIHYEVSNFALREVTVCRHNIKYWNHVPYLGLGPSAHSFDGTSRWWNTDSVEHYIDRTMRGTAPVENREVLTERQLHLERLALGFRTRDGVSLDTLKRFNAWETCMELLIAEGSVELKNERLIPTLNGYLIADRLALAFA